MIIDVPTHDDFEESGVDLLNLAWDMVMSLALELDDAHEFDPMIEDVEFWEAAQKPISTSLALVQQGTELLLKGRIAEVSPYLLIAGSPNEWHKGCDKNDTPFADFRTIDAQDLIRTHNTVAARKLPDEFVQKYENMRRLRNTIMHTVDKRIKKEFVDVFLTILEVFENLVEPQGWFRARSIYLEKHPSTISYSGEYADFRLVREGLKLLEILKPNETTKYFGYSKRHRSYICLGCLSYCRDTDIVPRTAQLKPNTPDSETVFCFVCNTERAVRRKDCEAEECRCNVIDVEEDETCLVCQRYQENV
jgi:hypothetical protein